MAATSHSMDPALDSPARLTIVDLPVKEAVGPTSEQRCLAWPGARILDACVAPTTVAGHLLVLTQNGSLHALDFDARTATQLCNVSELPALGNAEDARPFGRACHRLHASPDGGHAAIVADHGREGVVVDLRSGAITLRLDGGDYHENTVPFSACFVPHAGRSVLIHRTAWNRLDATDPATGASLTERCSAPLDANGTLPTRELNYFHGRLLPSPSGFRVFDDGWVWQPVSVPRSWSVSDWLHTNPWESEDGPSVVNLTMRDDWNTPACWVSERHVALWGTATWDDDEFAEVGQGAGVRIFDAASAKPSPDRPWPMPLHDARVSELLSDGLRLYVATDTGTTAWDLDTRTPVAEWPGFSARLLDPARGRLVTFGPDSVGEMPIP